MANKYKDDFDDFDDLDLMDDTDDMDSSQSIKQETNCPVQPQQAEVACDPCERRVGTCCFTTIPAPFTGNLVADSERLVYDVSCLSCVVRECTVDIDDALGCPPLGDLDVYQVRIVGCIPYIASKLLQTSACGGQATADGTVPDGDKRVAISCQGSVCVDNPICIRLTREEAQAVCDALNTSLASGDCTVVPARVFADLRDICPDALDPDSRVARFRVIFRLPSCPTVAP
ncbi:CryBP1 protein [Desulfonispora thiosulfatigenes DSM 11270]|uniref:CryBP1 protein n=1 Tax=Desulfonispora thiosulfatigenes DSM 11270 TaxID=656914 RepID=A0A1W1ULE1_DESTI|nr:hypothetical protein [Desulfonispora thiosulfatigenes]SMB81833.1 CryBP1 protein [Desulfonispora thiosulfatigenes DSM 11270]